MNGSIYASEWRPYKKVEPERLQAFLEHLIENPHAQIKHAADVHQIKYQRATALWRKHREYVEAKRAERANPALKGLCGEETLMDRQLQRHESQMIGLHALKQFDSEATAMKFQFDVVVGNRPKTRSKFADTVNSHSNEFKAAWLLKHPI